MRNPERWSVRIQGASCLPHVGKFFAGPSTTMRGGRSRIFRKKPPHTRTHASCWHNKTLAFPLIWACRYKWKGSVRFHLGVQQAAFKIFVFFSPTGCSEKCISQVCFYLSRIGPLFSLSYRRDAPRVGRCWREKAKRVFLDKEQLELRRGFLLLLKALPCRWKLFFLL